MSAGSGTERRGEHLPAGLLITPASREARRALGATAWAVLEEVSLDAEVDDRGRPVAVTNVRRVAAQLNINKDTAARALLRLADAGFVRRQSYRGRGAQFTSSTYVVRLDEATGIVRCGGHSCPTLPCSVLKDSARACQALDGQGHSKQPWPARPPSRLRSPGRRAARDDQPGLFDCEDRP